MKKLFALSTVLVAGFFAACSSDSSSSAKDDDPLAQFSKEDCTQTEKGIKVLLPKEGDKFNVGDEITIVYVANSPRAGGFRALYKVNEDDEGKDLFKNSFGEDAPDGTSCAVEKVVLNSGIVKASETAILRVQAYNEEKHRADVNIVVKE